MQPEVDERSTNPLGPFDVVYTWVNHADPLWQELHARATRGRAVPVGEDVSADDPARYIDRGELYWSIRSVRRHAPWVRRIHVVTNCAPPSWAMEIDALVWVPHETVFPNKSDLPTFNAHAIETVLHKVPGLSDRFLYLNDDFFLCRPVSANQFFYDEVGVRYTQSPHDIPYDRKTENLRPVDTGAINSARLLERDHGYRPRKKLQHTPYALCRSMLEELEGRYPNKIQATRAHAFRHPEDVAMATTLHAYYAHCTGRGKPSSIRTRYIDIGDWRFLGLVHPLSPLMRHRYDTFCLNEVTSLKFGAPVRDAIVRGVMKRLCD